MVAVAAPFVSMAISDKPGLVAGEPPRGGEKEVACMAISSKPGPEALREKSPGENGEWVTNWRRFIAEAHETYSNSDNAIAGLSSRST